MVVEIMEVIKHGNSRFVRIPCPDCKATLLTRHTIGTPNTAQVECLECKCVCTIAWKETDETTH